jgi:hypothetical protein
MNGQTMTDTKTSLDENIEEMITAYSMISILQLSFVSAKVALEEIRYLCAESNITDSDTINSLFLASVYIAQSQVKQNSEHLEFERVGKNDKPPA